MKTKQILQHKIKILNRISNEENKELKKHLKNNSGISKCQDKRMEPNALK